MRATALTLSVALLCGLTVWGASSPATARGLRIKRVALTGVHTAPLAVLQRAAVKGLPPGRISKARRRAAATGVKTRLRAALVGMGYLGARVRVTEHQPGAHTSFVVLRARIVEGKRYRVGALDVAGLGPSLRQRCLSAVRLRSGQYFDGADLRRSVDRVATVLADRGHAFVRVTLKRTLHRKRPLLDLTFGVRPGPVVTVGQVVVRGASSTGARLVRRALLVRRGARYHRSRLRRALARLRRTGAFTAVKLTEKALGKTRVQLTVTVVEAKP